MNINFKAKFINETSIKKYNYLKNSYEPTKVSFIEIDPENFSDYFAINEINQDWYNSLYASNITFALNLIKNQCLRGDIHKIYAITKQKNNFGILNSNEILALGEIERKTPEDIEINYLQVDPELVYSLEKRRFIDVGRAFLNCLKNFNYLKSITLNSNSSAAKFYEKNNFKLIDPEIRKFIWKKEIQK